MDDIEQDIDWTSVKPDQSPIVPLELFFFY